MPQITRNIGVLATRRQLDHVWADHSWQPSGLLPGVPDLAPLTRIAGDDKLATFFMGAADLTFFSNETSHYRDNLASGSPKVWVVLRPDGMGGVTLFAASADPYEGEAYNENMGDIVEALPMPEVIAEELAAFVAEHHIEQVFEKRKRKRYDPDVMAHRPLIERERR